MTIYLSDEEKDWIEYEPFNWHVKDGCPESICKTLKPKLQKLYGYQVNSIKHSKYETQNPFSMEIQ